MKGRRAAGRSGRTITIKKQADARAAMAPERAGIQSQDTFPPEAASGGLNLLVSTSLLERPETTQPARSDNAVARQVSNPDDVAAPHKIEEQQRLTDAHGVDRICNPGCHQGMGLGL